MTARKSDFLDVYFRFRVDRFVDQKEDQVRQRQVRRAWLLASTPVLLGAATAAEVLAATKVAVVIGAILAAACAVAALALVTGVIASASAASYVTSAGDETRVALARAYESRPESNASDRDIADWVRQVEQVQRGGDPWLEPGPDPT